MAGVVSLLPFLLLLQHAAVEVAGDYRVLVEVSSYDNPTNRCEECGGFSQTCCDTRCNNSCMGSARCDNKFYYCLREPGEEQLESDPLDCNPLVTTEVNIDGEVIDFNRSTVLGLSNPLSLQGLGTQWEGVQLYIEVQDLDSSTATRGNTVDYILVEIPGSVAPGGGRGERKLHNGEFGWAKVVLSYEVECLEGYTGEQCDVEDHCFQADCGSGECVNQEDGFSCICPDNFLGEFCETRNNCFGVDCGIGECVNEDDSFSCVCTPGYTGPLCQTRPSGNSAAAIGGAVVCVILLLLLLIAAGICVAIVWIRRASKHPHRSQRATIQPETNYMYIKKQPLAINPREAANRSPHSSPVNIVIPGRKLSDAESENEYAVPDTASMQTRMTINAAYGVSQEGRRETYANTREERRAWLYHTNDWETPSIQH